MDEDAATIARRCEDVGLGIAQLHGDEAREALFDLPETLRTVYVMAAHPDGRIDTPLPDELAAGLGKGRRAVDWVIVDSLKGGSGVAFDWAAVRVPGGTSRNGWLLAGGLVPDNVADAVRTARPDGVDVSSGVCGPDGLLKDAARVRAYVRNARGAAAE